MAGSEIEDGFLVNESQVVVNRAGTLRPHRESRLQEYRDQVVPREILPGVHQGYDRRSSLDAVQDARHGRVIDGFDCADCGHHAIWHGRRFHPWAVTQSLLGR